MAKVLELLAPARNFEIAREAVIHGADAVYIGGPGFGARAAAGNSIEDIRKTVQFAHSFHAKVYVTLNTIIFSSELEEVRSLIEKYYEIGVDALIVQDMAIARMKSSLPPIAIHASTQCDIRTPEKAAFLASAGFEQLVLPRELTLDEIADIRAAVPDDIVLEAFVHGALCVSYSGVCQAGFLASGRSANRGECPQICRLPYVVEKEDGKQILPVGHYLSLRDLNRLETMGDMIRAGISSFKIEGRLKDANYVRNVVAAYSGALDRIVESSGGKYARSSFGKVNLGFCPDLERTFNRGYTPFFLRHPDRSDSLKMASFQTPKWMGQPVGQVLTDSRSSKDGSFKVKTNVSLANGDGLTFVSPAGEIVGFRLNRIDGDILYPASKIDIRPRTVLYRNVDKEFLSKLDQSGTKRTIPVDIVLSDSNCASRIELNISGAGGVSVSEYVDFEFQKAEKPQSLQHEKALSKFGNTNYSLAGFEDRIPTRFVPASILNDLRRRAVQELDRKYQDLLPEKAKAIEIETYLPFTSKIDRHANVANPLAQQFYDERGIKVAESATEVRMPSDKEVQVMECRYCLRREIGECLKENPSLKNIPLYLRSVARTKTRYRLEFDCLRCRMKVIDCR